MVSILIVSVVIAVIAIILGGAFVAGLLDHVIEKIGVYIFKAEAKAEEKKLEKEGLKEGEDFSGGELKGNKKANDVLEGGIDDLKGKVGF